MDKPLRSTFPEFSLDSQRIDALPILNHFLQRLQLQTLLEKYLAACDVRSKIPAAKVLLVVLRNLVLCRSPLYSLSEWSGPLAPQSLGLSAEQKKVINDDRIGRALDELFDADRQALLTEFVIHMVREFQIDLGQLHNDSTSITLHGYYPEGDGRCVRGKPTPRVTFGYNKDHRPDLKQLLWILTISRDGAIPVYFKVCDGNVEDSSTHLENWNLLRQLVAGSDFLYVADSKLCIPETQRHIDQQAGSFLTPMPRSRREGRLFRQWLTFHTPEWKQIGRRPQPGQGVEFVEAMESPIAEANGFRLLWFRTARRVELDARMRQDALLRANHQLDRLKARLEGPRCRFKKLKMISRAVDTILNETRTVGWINYQIEQKNERIFRRKRSKNLIDPIVYAVSSAPGFYCTGLTI